jgi:hypothetical protein
MRLTRCPSIVIGNRSISRESAETWTRIIRALALSYVYRMWPDLLFQTDKRSVHPGTFARRFERPVSDDTCFASFWHRSPPFTSVDLVLHPVPTFLVQRNKFAKHQVHHSTPPPFHPCTVPQSSRPPTDLFRRTIATPLIG